jgi:hypothetical protein
MGSCIGRSPQRNAWGREAAAVPRGSGGGFAVWTGGSAGAGC